MAKRRPERIEFRKLGGSRQMLIRTGEDLARAANLDPALWVMTGVQLDALVFDRDFLTFLDTDKNGRIRCDEVKSALCWMISLLRDLSGAEKGSSFLALDALSDDNPEALALRETIRVALANLGTPDAGGITLDQIGNSRKIMANALQNGDGIIPPDALTDPLLADCVRDAMKLAGGERDINGQEGAGGAALDALESHAKSCLAWRERCDKEPEKLLPFGEKTRELCAAFQAVREKADDFFQSAAALRFTADGNRAGACGNTFDPLDAGSVRDFFVKAPAANPLSGPVLRRDPDALNPLWRGPAEMFFQIYSKALGREITSLNAEEWNELSAKLSPFEEWDAAREKNTFGRIDPERLRAYTEADAFGELRAMMERDLAVAGNLRNCETVRKLILYQKHMIDFLNNFVCMNHLFDAERVSMIQAGRLVMDGRIFTLCTPAPDPAEHKKIIQESDICVLYVDLSRGAGEEKKTMKIAVAVTSGDVRNLFIGKTGIFFTGGGETWDAKVFDFVQQPVSVSEAMREPFYRFAAFLRKQADKFFSARSKNYEEGLSKEIQSKAVPGAPLPGAPRQTPAVSGSMLLMGGGIGIAAIGSAFAFMIRTLQGISVSTVLAVFSGILLVFGGPVVLISLVKLFRRNLSRFFEANGCAMNPQMRLSLRMGRIFTYRPKMPFRAKVLAMRLPSVREAAGSGGSKLRFFLWLLLILLLVFAFFLAWPFLARAWNSISACFRA